MSAIKDGEMFALLCFMGGGCLNALRKAKMSESRDACCLFSLKAEKNLPPQIYIKKNLPPQIYIKKNLPPQIYIKHSIFRVNHYVANSAFSRKL